MPHYYHDVVGQAPPLVVTDDNLARGRGHSDEYIRTWQPLMPLDASRLTSEQRKIILDKLYRRHFIVYDRLAEI